MFPKAVALYPTLQTSCESFLGLAECGGLLVPVGIFILGVSLLAIYALPDTKAMSSKYESPNLQVENV